MTGKDKQTIINEALGEFVHVMSWRRMLHRYPELSFEEKRTARFIGQVLAGDGIRHRAIAGTGVLAAVEGRGGEDAVRRAVVLRADIDALPVTEASGLEFASCNSGVMHACGHDMHTAILLGALRIINRHRDEFSGTVFGLFQPGEELNPGGAQAVLEEDPFAGYSVEAFVGQHVEPSLRTGTFGFRAGQYMASSDELRFHVRGRGGHAALRASVIDPVEAAADLVGRLYAIPASGGNTILSIGRVDAAGATNVVPDEVYMEGTMRTFDEKRRAAVKELVFDAAAAVDARFGVSTEVDISEGYPSVCNDLELTGRITAATAALFGPDSVEGLALRPTSDDFGRYTGRYPSLYYRLGVGGTGEFYDSGAAGRIHTPAFRPDEKALGYGVVQFVNIVFTLLGGDPAGSETSCGLC